MSIQLTHVRLASAHENHQNIAWLRWRNDSDGSDGESAVETLTRWIDNGGEVFVQRGALKIGVRAVRPDGREAYLQAYIDGAGTNDLLDLPRF